MALAADGFGHADPAWAYDWQQVRLDVPVQQDMSSCGVHMLAAFRTVIDAAVQGVAVADIEVLFVSQV